MIEKALRIALEAHEGQVDKAGAPYVLHPIRVMLKLPRAADRIAGLLHDVIEDSDWTQERLVAEGFSEEILAAVECLTCRPGESYGDFLGRVKANPVAVRVKIADLEDNLDITRLKEISDKDRARMNKYLNAWRELNAL